jgi:hypothetical protein
MQTANPSILCYYKICLENVFKSAVCSKRCQAWGLIPITDLFACDLGQVTSLPFTSLHFDFLGWSIFWVARSNFLWCTSTKGGLFEIDLGLTFKMSRKVWGGLQSLLYTPQYYLWSIVAEWLGRRTSPKAQRDICEQDTLKSTARGSQNKQNCLRHGTYP